MSSTGQLSGVRRPPLNITKALDEEPELEVGETVAISVRYPIGHYRVPRYVRGKRGIVEAVIDPKAVNNETEGYGQNAGSKGFYYRVAISLAELWPGYAGSPADGLRIEVFQTWLERSK